MKATPLVPATTATTSPGDALYGEVVRAAVVVATVRLLSVAVSRVLTRSSLYSGCAVRTQRHYASPSAAREFFWTGKPGG